MKNNKTAHPLSWPDGWTRTKHPVSSQFKTSLNGALNNVNKSVELFAKDSKHKVENIIISSNVTLGELKPSDSGVAIYFSWNGISTCIAVDRYKKVEDNLQAIHHCIEAERVKLRHGGINLVQAAFRGYAALPPGTGSGKNWWSVLSVAKNGQHETIESEYNRLRSLYHPDKSTGDAAKFDEVQKAWEQYKDE
ncbi:MAG: DnaJ domain-containing protein [Gammaproteobacteria bacterium]|nr:DnaJ domain-containing protein [Gammaproteobacteria bacterium]